MPRQTERIPLLGPGPGTRQEVMLHRYGTRGSGRKAYLQASLHADETPAMLALQHLLPLLERADREGRITGEIVIVPFANPLGLAQWVNETHLGRYELRGGGNFNRGWPDLAERVAAKVEGKLVADAAANVATIRAAILDTLSEGKPRKELDLLKLVLARESATADLVLDLHCDDDSLLHLFLIPQHWPEASDIAAEFGMPAVLLAEDSGGGAFDEFNSTLWVKLARRFPEHPIPPACVAATVELRGQADVSDELGAADGAALYRILARRGFLREELGALPPLECEATDLTACQSLRVPAGGIIVYRVALGARVRKGDLVAEIVDPAAAPGTPRLPLHAGTDGLVLSRVRYKFVATGQAVMKIVGREPLAERAGYLLED